MGLWVRLWIATRLRRSAMTEYFETLQPKRTSR